MRRSKLNLIVLLALSAWETGALAGESTEPVDAAPFESDSLFRAQTPEGVPSLQLSTDFVSPELSFGDYGPMGRVQSRGVKAGPFTIRVAAQAGIGYDSNVAASQTDRISSMFSTLNPSVAVGLEGATQRYHLVYRGNYGIYTSSSEDNYDDHSLTLSAGNDWTTRFRTTAAYEYLRGHTPRGATTDTLSRQEEWDVNAVRGTASYGASGARGGLEGSLGYSERRYATSRATSAIRDYDRFDASGAFLYRIAPRTRGLVQVEYSDLQHPNDPSLDSTESRYLVGATWDVLAKTQGSLRVGYMTKDFAQAARGEFSGPTYQGAITWSPLTYSQINLNARRTFGESVESGSIFVVATRVTAAWNHAWSDRVQTTLGYGYGRLEHEGAARTDTYQNVTGRMSYAIERWWRVGAEIRYDNRDSNTPAFNYKRAVTLLTMEAAI